MNTVMIIAGESSGELYGSLLARELKQRDQDMRIIGVGGQRMREAGVELLSTISDAFGLVEAVASLQKLKDTYKGVITAMKELSPMVLILIDYPDFNLKVAGKAKSLGIKILYYVSPQVWAWRKGRVKKIAGIVNRMAVILPFEEKLYKDAGLPCEFVGHPVMEEINLILQSAISGQHSVNDNRIGIPPHPSFEKGGEGVFESFRKKDMKAALGFHPEKPLLSLLPGSRPHELQKLLPVMLDVIRKLRNEPDMNAFKEYQFCMPLAPNTDETTYRLLFEDLNREGVAIKKGESVRVLAASDLAVVASGTATLQTAFLEVPMVVVYKLSPLTYHLGRRIVKVKHISLVNILSGRTVVRELLQKEANPEEITKELKKILLDAGYREEMLSYCRAVRRQFQGKHASKRVAEIITEMMREK
jgi:lipid-A-disaccharide synthase